MNLESFEYGEDDIDLPKEELRELMKDDTDCRGCSHNKKGYCAFYHVDLERSGSVYIPCDDCLDDCGEDTAGLDEDSNYIV